MPLGTSLSIASVHAAKLLGISSEDEQHCEIKSRGRWLSLLFITVRPLCLVDHVVTIGSLTLTIREACDSLNVGHYQTSTRLEWKAI